MTETPSYLEEPISQIPALQLLMALGYEYLTPEEAQGQRGGKLGDVVLVDILEGQLRKLNRVRTKGHEIPFSDNNIRLAMEKLTNEPYDGLLRTNEKLYELLTLGTTQRQTIDGDTRSYSLQYIDWQHPENNVYHVTDEFVVERTRSQKTRRPDIVCFVNGIPLVVIENKRPDKQNAEGESAVQSGISQMLRNQRPDEIPQLFIFSQLLMSLSRNDALYATTETPKKFWTLWREQEAAKLEPELNRLINQPLSEAEKDHLYGFRDYGRLTRRYFDELAAAGDRLATEQDRLLFYLMRPEQLLELIYGFIVFDGPHKKIARYQQYFAVQETIARAGHLTIDGVRGGGVIWHTTGSGKSLTMVMLAKALALHPAIANPKVILVTDRINLDDQIYGTFKACGKNVKQASSGRHLMQLVADDNADIVTTVIDKFETVAKEKRKNDSADIFILVDEGHRSQYGVSHARMRQVFPRASLIGFTGTPLLKKEKSTAARFGSFIHTYPIRQAVEDKAIVPLLYEGRLVELGQNQAMIDQWFERATRDLSAEQKLDLKRKFSRQDEVYKIDQRIQQIAYDVSDHFRANFQGTGAKAQLAVPSKAVALKYKEYLDEFGMVSSDVVISGPDTREGHSTVDDVDLPPVQAFWRAMMARYGSERKYNREIKADFHREEGVEILIVVDKLLTGFDEPRNTVLYIDKPLKEHGLLQAISRVNRLFEGKEYGLIVDYRGVLGELNETINTYDALAGFDLEDIEGTVTDVREAIKQLPGLHSALWGVFRSVANKQDVEALEQFLAPEDRRQAFYQALREYAKVLQVALTAVAFYEETAETEVRRYKQDLAFFDGLRRSVKQRYAETINYGTYEQKIRKLMDDHISATYVTTIVREVNIFDAEAFEAEVEKLEGDAARADTIAHRMKQTISEKMEQDPAFYRKFSSLIEETIAAYRQDRIDEAEYYQQALKLYREFAQGHEASLPGELRHHKHAPAYYGIVIEAISPETWSFRGNTDAEALGAEMAIRIEQIIEGKKIRDWVHNRDVQNQMMNEIEDYLFSVKGRYEIDLKLEEIDEILEQVIHTAKQRNEL